MECYACDKEATQRCPRCGHGYCAEHAPAPDSGQALCSECLDPVKATPSSVVFRTALFALLAASVLALWLIVRPPSLPGESSGAIKPLPTTSPLASPSASGGSPSPVASASASPTATPSPPPAPTPPPQPTPIEYVVQKGDTWYGIAAAYGVQAERLAAYNGKTLNDIIRPGDVISIPQ